MKAINNPEPLILNRLNSVRNIDKNGPEMRKPENQDKKTLSFGNAMLRSMFTTKTQHITHIPPANAIRHTRNRHPLSLLLTNDC